MKIRILIVIVIMVNFVIALDNDISSTQGAQVESEFNTPTTSEATEQLSNFDIASSSIERSGHAHVHVDPTFKGFWRKKFAWQPRWVKTWQEKKVYVAVWKRMWGPMVVKEWVPVPRPPPGWTKSDVASYIVKNPYH